MEDCLFCRIAAGELPSETVAADERTLAFMDIAPASEGHVVVIPRAHAPDVHAIDDDDLAAVARTARLIAGRAAEALGADAVKIVQNNGPLAGQTVFHYHVHVIPSYAADPLPPTWTPRPASREDLARTAMRLRGEG